jgi:hypothetical protein
MNLNFFFQRELLDLVDTGLKCDHDLSQQSCVYMIRQLRLTRTPTMPQLIVSDLAHFDTRHKNAIPLYVFNVKSLFFKKKSNVDRFDSHSSTRKISPTHPG